MLKKYFEFEFEFENALEVNDSLQRKGCEIGNI